MLAEAKRLPSGHLRPAYLPRGLMGSPEPLCRAGPSRGTEQHPSLPGKQHLLTPCAQGWASWRRPSSSRSCSTGVRPVSTCRMGTCEALSCGPTWAGLTPELTCSGQKLWLRPRPGLPPGSPFSCLGLDARKA